MPAANATLVSSFVVFTSLGDGKDWDTRVDLDLLTAPVDTGSPVASFSGLDASHGDICDSNGNQKFVDLSPNLTGVAYSDFHPGALFMHIEPVGSDTWDFDLMLRVYFSDLSFWQNELPNHTLSEGHKTEIFPLTKV